VGKAAAGDDLLGAAVVTRLLRPTPVHPEAATESTAVANRRRLAADMPLASGSILW
jgi:hypothetical protein